MTAAVAFASAQRVGQTVPGTETRKALPVRLGPDGRPLLFSPKINMCQNSKCENDAVRRIETMISGRWKPPDLLTRVWIWWISQTQEME